MLVLKYGDEDMVNADPAQQAVQNTPEEEQAIKEKSTSIIVCE